MLAAATALPTTRGRSGIDHTLGKLTGPAGTAA